jgi:hypothetical protein
MDMNRDDPNLKMIIEGVAEQLEVNRGRSPILEEWETCGNRAEMLLPYQSGSWGPDAVKNLFKLSPTNG